MISSAAVYADFLIQLSSGRIIGPNAPSDSAADPAGPGLSEAVTKQLGLRLVRAEQVLSRLFVIDRITQRPTEN